MLAFNFVDCHCIQDACILLFLLNYAMHLPHKILWLNLKLIDKYKIMKCLLIMNGC